MFFLGGIMIYAELLSGLVLGNTSLIFGYQNKAANHKTVGNLIEKSTVSHPIFFDLLFLVKGLGNINYNVTQITL